MIPSQIIHIAPSARLGTIQGIAHLGAFASILVAAIPSWLTVLLLVLVGASLAHSRRPQAVTTLQLHGDGRLEKLEGDGAVQPIEVHPHTLVLSFVAVLLYRQNGRVVSCVVLPDCLPAEDFRQLRIWLRWRAVQPAGLSSLASDAAPSPTLLARYPGSRN